MEKSKFADRLRFLKRALPWVLAVLGVFIAHSARAVYENYTFVTLAGAPEAGTGARDGTGVATRFGSPAGVARDGNGNFYVADTVAHTIRKISSNGVVTTVAGLAGVSGSADGRGAAARFNSPNGVAVDGGGNVYVADTGNHTIRKISPEGVVTTIAGSAGSIGNANGTGNAARFNFPYGITINAGNELLVADTFNNLIRKIDSSAVVTTFAGTGALGTNDSNKATSAGFSRPISTAIDSVGNIYVADAGNHTIRRISAAGVVTTLAGLARVSGGADGTNSTARFNTPYGVTVDSADNVYVADTFNHTIRQITPAGVVTTYAGSAGVLGGADDTGTFARFNFPVGIVAAGATLYVGDYSNSKVRKIAPGAVVTTLAGVANVPANVDGEAGAARFRFPASVATTTNGVIYVADLGNHTIRKISPLGQVTTIAGTAGTAGTNDGNGLETRFREPTGLAVDSEENIYVADTANHTIRKITPLGAVSTWAGKPGVFGTSNGMGDAARFNRPFAVVVDASNNVYVADTGNHAIRKISPSREVSVVAGMIGASGTNDGTGTDARFSFPEGLAFDGAGNLYIADDGNHTIRKMDPEGTVSTLAGRPGQAGSADGAQEAARFNYPFGVAVDASGNVFVGDTGNNVIRKITSAGNVTTLGGLSGAFGNLNGTGRDAAFSSPEGVAVDNNGNVYVADASNHAIRKGYPSPPDHPTVDSATNGIGVLRQLNVSNLTTTNWSWSIIRHPSHSAAQLSGTSIVNPTFTPDVEDVFVLRFQAWDSSNRTVIKTLTIIADETPPTVNIAAPASNQRWSNSVFSATGAAADNIEVAEVWCRVNGQAWIQATGKTNWSASLNLTPGTNLLQAYARDTAGNFSGTQSVAFVYVVNAPIVVQANGSGTINPNYNGQLLEIGKSYSMTASPSSGFRFVNWTGSQTTDSPTLNFQMQSNLTFTANFADAVKPVLTITSPKSGQRWSNEVFTVTGTASDNGQLAGVWCQVNGGGWIPAAGASAWTFEATLLPGNNTISAFATDVDGNVSSTNTVTLVYVLSDQLTVVISGDGTLTPNYHGVLLELGKSYTMTAKAGAGYVFSNWTDNASVLTTQAALTFTMQSNLTLHANFVPNPFGPVAGTYAGLFYDTNGVTATNAGYFTATLTGGGAFSAGVYLGKKPYSLSGQFSAGGVFSNSIIRKGLSPLSVRLQLDLTGGDIITGQISDSSWTAELVANRNVYSTANPAPQAGKRYSLVLPGGGNTAARPGGNSYGTLTADALGNLSFTGVLADNTKAAQRTFVSKQGHWPFYVSLYSGQGLILGWLSFVDVPETDLSGTVVWIKQPQLKAKLYSAGFVSDIEAVGSQYIFTPGIPLLTLTNGGVLVLEQGNLPQPITNYITLGPDNRPVSTNGIKLSITTTTGLFKGSVPNPGGKALGITGVLLQKQNAADGTFYGLTQSGSVSLESP